MNNVKIKEESSDLKASEANEPIAHTSEQDVRFMRMALRQAQIAFDMKEIPIGCVIVKDGVVIGKGYNQVEQLKDATAHAEIIAIGTAQLALGRLYALRDARTMPHVRRRYPQQPSFPHCLRLPGFPFWRLWHDD